MSTRGYIVRSGLTGIANTAGSALSAVLFIPLLVRNAGFETYGIWSMLLAFVGLASAAEMGSSKAMVYFLARAASPEERGEVLVIGLGITLLAMAAVLVLGTAALASGLPLWGLNASFSRVGNSVIGTGMAIACLSIATTFLRSILESLFKLHVVNAGFLLLTVLNYGAAFLTTKFFAGVRPLFITTVSVYTVIFLFHLAATSRCLRYRPCRPGRGKVREVLRYSLRFWMAGLAGTALLLAARYLIVAYSFDGVSHGIFDLAVKIAAMANGLIAAFAVPLFGVFSERGAERIGEIRAILGRQVALNLGFYLLGCVGFLLGGRTLLGLFLASNLEPTYRVSLLLVVCLCLAGVFEPLTRALWALGHLDSFLKIQMVALVVFILAAILLAGRDPLQGVSLAYALSVGLSSLLVAAVSARAFAPGAPGNS